MGGASAESDPRLEGGSSDSMSRFRVSKFRHVEAKVARKEVSRAYRRIVSPVNRRTRLPGRGRQREREPCPSCLGLQREEATGSASASVSDPTEEGRPTAGLSRARMDASFLPSELRPGRPPDRVLARGSRGSREPRASKRGVVRAASGEI